MTVKKPDVAVKPRPRDDLGHFVPLKCPIEGCDGELILEDEGFGPRWRCNGLIDPGDPEYPLEECRYCHIDGDTYRVA